MISRSSTIAALVAFAGVLISGSGNAEPTGNYTQSIHGGRAAVYQQLNPNSLESVTSPEAIREAAMGNSPSTKLWQVLEHGEKVECLSCIPAVSRLLYNSIPKTREISAWWLRRRIFGVFGPGEVYSQVLNTLKTDTSDVRRAYSAEALGEFLLWNGVPAVANAAIADSSPMVRLSAVRALERLNSEGPNAELATALSDQESSEVRLAALQAASRVNVFSRPDLIAPLLSDATAEVRRRAAEVLGTMRSSDAVMGLIALTDPAQESDPSVRTSAVGALGKIADPTARDAVEAALSDSDPLVQSIAEIALRRL